MQISPVSNPITAFNSPAAPAPAAKSAAPAAPTDSVHLSAAALAKSGDADHDGDSH